MAQMTVSLQTTTFARLRQTARRRTAEGTVKGFGGRMLVVQFTVWEMDKAELQAHKLA